jgi:hypothetical protein
MKRCSFPIFRVLTLAAVLLPGMYVSAVRAEAPSHGAAVGFNTYVAGVEARLARQHSSAKGFLVGSSQDATARMRAGELIVDKVEPSSGADLPGALLHHWRGTAFVPGARVTDFERLMKDFGAYPQKFAPQVVRTKILSEQGDRMQATMRVRQQHVITVVMDITYDIAFGRLDAQHGYNSARSTRIVEIDAPGTAGERVLSADEEHGFLWRLNTYWSCEERDGGLYMQIESVSLTRSIPRGLGWAVGPYVETVPRESMEFTLRSAANALRR